jgi:adenylate kinase
MLLILLGAPGAGKGTQGALLAERLGIPKIATGDILRDAVRRGTELGRKAREYMDAGELVPDEVILGLVRDVLSSEEAAEGAILDGFPRTVPQAEALQGILAQSGRSIDAVVEIDVGDEVIVRRMSGRRSCAECGRVFNVHTEPPRREGVCDACGGTLVQRDDDREETVRRRLEVYRASTAPLVEFYRAAGARQVRVAGDRPIDAVQAEILERLPR